MAEHDGFTVEVQPERKRATVTLDRPDKLNRIAIGAREQIAEVFRELGADQAVRVVVLAGAPGRAFTAGGDVAGFLERSPEQLSHLARNVAAPERCPKPVIAALHGFTLGVGLELALACDLRVAAQDTELGMPEINLGMIPGSGGTQRLARLVGAGRAKDMVFRGRRVGAEEALAWGLLTRVVPADELDAAVDALVEELSGKAGLALAMAKRVINLAYDGPLHLGLEVEGLAYGLLRSTHDFREGVEAFVEKRAPAFEDR
ncbi:MAG: enoyl-CoA hydratase/isomerase family protein [Acidimicrobiales bacterium]